MAVLERTLRQVAVSTAEIARYCDNAEHNELLDRAWVIGAGECFRQAALELAAAFDLDAHEAYAKRLRAIEAVHLLAAGDGFDGHAEAGAAWTWQDLQRVQIEHDRRIHPDVFGLSKAEQLRHYLLHSAKLTGFLASATIEERSWPML